jgi:hypothetical protein
LDENSVVFHYKQRSDFAALRDAVQTALAAMQTGPAQSADQGASRVPEQIAKLAELRDAGVLTEAEFAAKKTELLGRM